MVPLTTTSSSSITGIAASGLSLTIRKFYDDVSLSHLAVMQVTATGDADPNIFICKDNSLKGGTGIIPEQLVGIYEEVKKDPITGLPIVVGDPACVPVYRQGVWYEYLAEDIDEMDMQIYPNRVLQAIASPTDMGVYEDTDNPISGHPVGEPEEGNILGMYRTYTVSIMTNSLDKLDEVINLIYNDYIRHGQAMDKLTTDITLHNAVPYIDPNNNNQYIFPEK